MFCYLKQKSRNKCVKNHIKRCNKKHNKKTKTLQWQQYQRLYRYKDLMYKIHNIPAWQLSHKKHQQQQEYLRNLKCDKLQIEIRIYKEFYKKEASHEHINVKSLNDTFNTNINTTTNNNNNNNNNNNKHQKYANLLSKNFIINYNKQQQRFITRHEQQTETDDIELQEEEAEEEKEKASWEIFNHNRNTRVENSLQNIIFMLNTYQQILINFNKIDNNHNNNNNTTNNKYNLKFNNNNYNYKYILKNEPKPINEIAEILMSIQHIYMKNNNNLKTGTARSTSFNNLQFNEKIVVKQDKFKTKEITISTTPPNEIVTVTGSMQETETICKEINITIIVNSNIKQHSHPTNEHHEHHEQHEQMKEEEIEEEEEKVIKTVKNVKPSHYQQIEHYIHEYQIQKHLRRQNQQQQQQQQQLSEKPASANKHNTNHYNNNKNNNNIMIKNHLNNEKKSIIYTNEQSMSGV